MNIRGRTVAIYCRVDSGGGAESRQILLNLQREQLVRYAAGKHLSISECYEDNGYSGDDMERPGLKQLLGDCETGRVNTVLVMNRNRLFRGRRCDEPKWPFALLSLNQLEREQGR